MSKDSIFAFPKGHSDYTENRGMTLRDYFAAKFMCGRAAGPGFVDPSNDAEMAYRVADAMLKERAK